MPILSAEPDSYPQNLWEDAAPLPVKPDGQWWCLHTKPRQEKATARDLREQGVVYYLPQTVKESRTPQGRRLQSVVPLFAGYMFLYGDPRDRVAALRGNRLVNILEVVDQDGLVRDLRQVARMLSSGLTITAETMAPVGAKVRINTGPLTGIIGTVIRRGKRDQFVAVVHFLGRGATVDLQDWQVETVPGDP
jgi:transcription antitermination factor NusG